MTVERRLGCELVGLSSDPKPDHDGLIGYRFYETDTGFIYYHTGVMWSLVSGWAETESFANKNISVDQNTISGLATNASIALNAKRSGSFYPAVGGPALIGAMAGMNVSVGTGENAFSTYDPVEGIYQNFRINLTTEKAGIQSTTSTNSLTTTFGQNPYIKFRMKFDDVTGIRRYFGWTDQQSLPVSNAPLAGTDSGVIIGFGATDANYTVYCCDGSGTAQMTDFGSGIAKDTDWHTFEIDASGNNVVVCRFDGANDVTLGSHIPDNSTVLYFNNIVQYV